MSNPTYTNLPVEKLGEDALAELALNLRSGNNFGLSRRLRGARDGEHCESYRENQFHSYLISIGALSELYQWL